MEDNKKYRLIIVDDQPNVREGLKQYFQDCDLGFEVCEVFADGSAAYDWLINHTSEVDVVLTDIRMPKISGLQLAQMMSEQGWNFKIVFLSLYQEFEYAKAALNLGVYAYLTKPIQFSELDKVFLNLKATLDNEFLIKTDISVLREEFFNQLFSKNVDVNENLFGKMKWLRNSEDILNEPYAEIAIRQNLAKDSERWRYGADRFVNFILNVLRNEKFLYYVVQNENNLLRILAISKENGVFADVESFKNMLVDSIDEGMKNIRQIVDMEFEVESVDYYESFYENWNFKLWCKGNSNAECFEAKTLSVIEKSLIYIDENYNKEISLADAAEFVGLNPLSYSRIFKDFTSENFTDYLILKRVEKAKEMLRKSHATIQDISTMVGYRDEKYFMRLFKKKTGMTPNEYRRKEQNS